MLALGSSDGSFHELQQVTRLHRSPHATEFPFICWRENGLCAKSDNGSLNIYAITFQYISLLETSVTQDARKDWRNLCREAVSERDPYKLIAIVDELNRELDEEQKKKAAVFLRKIDKKTA